MAITLNDLLKNTRDAVVAGVLQNMLRMSDLLKLLPISDVDALRVSGLRWQTLPSTGTRKIGGSYTEASGATEPVSETLAVYGGDVQVDRILTKVRNTFVDELQNQMAMKGQSLAALFNHHFINGDHASNPDTIEGLKKRVSNLPARMSISLASGTDSLKVLASAVNEHLFIDALHEAVHKVGGAKGDGGVRGALVMNEGTYLGVGKTLRRLGLMDTSRDQYDRTWETFRGFALVDVGLQSDMATEIITATEDPGDGGNDATSIYAAKFGEDDGLHLIQLAGTGPDAYDPLKGGEKEATPAFLRRIDWAIGLRVFGSYAIARIKDFKMAAS